MTIRRQFGGHSARAAVMLVALFTLPSLATSPLDPLQARADEYQIRNARRYFEISVDSRRWALKVELEEPPEDLVGAERDLYFEWFRYYLSANEYALKLLANKKASDFRSPVPFCAALCRLRKTGHVQLDLRWLEEGWATDGVYLSDADGKTTYEFRWTNWPDAFKLVYSVTLNRFRIFPVVLDATPEKKKPASIDDVEIRIPSRILAKPLKVGLLTKDGKRSKPIDVKIDPSLRKAKPK